MGSSSDFSSSGASLMIFKFSIIISNKVIVILLMDLFFRQIIQNPSLLQIGQALIKERLSLKSNRSATIELLKKEANVYIIILSQNILVQLWNDLQQDQKSVIRTELLQSLYVHHNDLKFVQALAIFISKIHNVEGYHQWQSMYNHMTNHEALLESNIEYFLILFRQSDNNINALASFILGFLYRAISLIPVECRELQEKVLILAYGTIRSFSSFESADKELVEKCFGDTFEVWIIVLINILKNNSFKHLHKYTLKILTVIYADMPKYSAKSLNLTLNTIWLYFNLMIPVYIRQNIQEQPKYGANNSVEERYITDINFEESTWSQGIIYQCIELMESILIQKRLKVFNLFAIYVVCNNLFNLLLISKNDQKEWLDDPNKFIADNQDENTLNVRNRILSFITVLLEYNSSVSQILEAIIQNGLNRKSQTELKQVFLRMIQSKNIESKLQNKIFNMNYTDLIEIFNTSFVALEEGTWKRQQASFLLLNTYNQNLININNGQLIELLSKQVQHSKHQLLRVQALNALLKCTENIELTHYGELFNYSIQIFNSDYLGLKIVATKAIGVFARKLRTNHLNQNVAISQEFIYRLVEFLQKLSQDTLHIILDTLIQLAKFNSNIKKLISNHIERYSIKLLETFYNDGLLSNAMLELFTEATSLSQQQYLVKKTVQLIHNIQYEELIKLYINIMENHIKNSTILLPVLDLLIFIKILVKVDFSESIIRAYLQFEEIDQQLILMLESQMRISWVIPLHRRGFTINLTKYLQQSVRVVLEVTSQSQLQHALVLPLYLLYKSFQQTAIYLKGNNLYNLFIQKWLKLLLKACIIILVQVPEIQYKTHIKKYIQSNQKKLVQQPEQQWQNEEGSEDDDIYKQFDAYQHEDLVNDRVQQLLASTLPELSSVKTEQILAKYLST